VHNLHVAAGTKEVERDLGGGPLRPDALGKRFDLRDELASPVGFLGEKSGREFVRA